MNIREAFEELEKIVGDYDRRHNGDEALSVLKKEIIDLNNRIQNLEYVMRV